VVFVLVVGEVLGIFVVFGVEVVEEFDVEVGGVEVVVWIVVWDVGGGCG